MYMNNGTEKIIIYVSVLPKYDAFLLYTFVDRGCAVAQLVEPLRYKSEGYGFDGVTGIFH